MEERVIPENNSAQTHDLKNGDLGRYLNQKKWGFDEQSL